MAFSRVLGLAWALMVRAVLVPVYRNTVPVYRSERYTGISRTGIPKNARRLGNGGGMGMRPRLFHSKIWVLASLYSYRLLFQLVFLIASSTCAREKNYKTPVIAVYRCFVHNSVNFRFKSRLFIFILCTSDCRHKIPSKLIEQKGILSVGCGQKRTFEENSEVVTHKQ